MLYESPHVRVEASDGIATLWLEFPGSPVNALTPPRLAALDCAVSAVVANPHLEILVIRSARPAGFCGGHDPAYLAELTSEDAQSSFALAGQWVFNRLAELELVTVAFIEGPCLGPGLELALACDYRLAVAGPDSMLGFPHAAIGLPPCWGGATRLPSKTPARLLTAREALRVGLVDVACCARRGKIELRTLLDQLQFHPRKRRSRRSGIAEGLAAERSAFRAALCLPKMRRALRDAVAEARSLHTDHPVMPFPELVGLIGLDAQTTRFAVEIALRGTSVAIAASDSDLSPAFAEIVRRGRATPLEAEQARARIRVNATSEQVGAAGWVIAVDSSTLEFVERGLRPRTVLSVWPDQLSELAARAERPGRLLGLNFIHNNRVELTPSCDTTPDTLAAVAAWMRRLGFAPILRQETFSDAVLQTA